MDRERWERIREICLAAMEQPTAAYESVIVAACAGDRGLEAEVRDLLAIYLEDPDFLEEPIVRMPDLHETHPLETESSTIGGYRTIRPLGRGGMGQVLLAVREQGDFRQTVAIKLILRGHDTDDVLRRFRLERRILAGLHHPHIAQLIDGGATDDGRPYFVMEYIEGVPIDVHCDGERLTVRQRLELFLRICGAVQHAHQSLVVHRDIKPGNILVTPDGAPKLLDFGIAKVLEGDEHSTPSALTRYEDRVLTPEYAAPEQISGEAITTATDVYALGVLLYDLLTGRHPHGAESRTSTELERAILDEDPVRPSAAVTRAEAVAGAGEGSVDATPEALSASRSTDPRHLRRSLTGDLDNIVLKALRRDRFERYASVAALAEDIERHLQGLPVRARPASLGYRAGKFVRRHAVMVTAVIGLCAAAMAAGGVTVVQSRRVAAERDNAIAERDKAVEVRGFLMEMFGSSSADQAADSVTVRRLLDIQAATVEEAYPDRPDLRAEMMDVLADGYDRLGLAREALPLAERAVELRREVQGDDHPDLATSLNTYGWVLHELGRSAEAEAPLREAVRLRRQGGPAHRAVLSRSLNDLGIVVEELGSLEEGAALFREALSIRRDVFGSTHRSVGITANNLAVNLFRRGDYDGAAEFGAEALTALQASVGTDHQRSVIAQSNLMTFRRARGDLEGAEDVGRDLLARQTRIQGRRHPVTALAMDNLASVLVGQGQLDEAEALYREALEVREALQGPSHPDLVSPLSGLADVIEREGRPEEALGLVERALTINVGSYGEVHRNVAATLADLAELYLRLDRVDEALDHYRRAVAMWDTTLGPDHPRTNALRLRYARTLLSHDRPDAALAEMELVQARAGAAGSGRLRLDARVGMAEAQLALGRVTVADSLLRESEAESDGPNVSDALRARMTRLRSRIGGR